MSYWGFVNMFTDALNEYRKHNGCLPERIGYHRDGVNEGQIGDVCETEVNAIKV
jgi:hypothetical protein